jgi:hypothetical protein
MAIKELAGNFNLLGFQCKMSFVYKKDSYKDDDNDVNKEDKLAGKDHKKNQKSLLKASKKKDEKVAHKEEDQKKDQDKVESVRIQFNDAMELNSFLAKLEQKKQLVERLVIVNGKVLDLGVAEYLNIKKFIESSDDLCLLPEIDYQESKREEEQLKAKGTNVSDAFESDSQDEETPKPVKIFSCFIKTGNFDNLFPIFLKCGIANENYKIYLNFECMGRIMQLFSEDKDKFKTMISSLRRSGSEEDFRDLKVAVSLTERELANAEMTDVSSAMSQILEAFEKQNVSSCER